MPVIPLVPSDSPALIASPFRANTLSLLLSFSAPFVRTSFGSRSFSVAAPKSGTLSLYLYVPVPVPTPFVVTSRPTTASRPSTPLNRSPLAPQIRLC